MAARALLIGIDDYYEVSSLKGPKADVLDIKNWLTGQSVVVEELVSESGKDVFSATPRTGDVEDWLDKLAGEVAKVKKANGGVEPDFPLGDRLYIFYAGHGYDAYTSGPTGIFPRTRVDNWDVLPFGPLERCLKNLAYFREIVIIVDACRELIDYSYDPTWKRRPTANPNSIHVQVLVLNAADSSQKTQELDFGGGKIRGVLSQAFLNGVKGLAAEGGDVTATRLKEYVVNAVRDKLPKANPKIEIPNDPMVVATAPTINPKIEITCSAGSAGNAVLRRNAGGENPITLQEGKNTFEVPLGAYTLVLPNGTEKPVNAIWEVNLVEV